MQIRNRDEFGRAADKRRLDRAGRRDALRGLAITVPAMVAAVGALVAVAAYSANEAPAIEARLIGQCNGKLMAAKEESSFPAGCAWIEPIRYQAEPEAAPLAFKELSRAAIVRVGLVESSR